MFAPNNAPPLQRRSAAAADSMGVEGVYSEDTGFDPSVSRPLGPTCRLLSAGPAGAAYFIVASALASCAQQNHGRPTVPAELPMYEGEPVISYPEHGFDDSIVRIVSPHVSCTGTLIAPDRVLTAHHCLAERDEFGDYLPRDVAVEDVHVQLGSDYLPWGEVSVRAIVAPACGYGAGTGDIAILVLEHPLAQVPTKRVALETNPKKGLSVEPVGFGRCADSDEGIRLRSRRGGQVDVVKASGFQLEAAICPGDSGGPGVTSSGVVVGIVSASALDGRQDTVSRTEFTRVDRWPDVFANAQRISEGENPAELPPISGCPSEDNSL